MNQKRILTIVLVVTVVVFIVVTSYFIFFKKSVSVIQRSTPSNSITPQPETSTQGSLSSTQTFGKVADWNTLVNKYGWSIKFPSDWGADGIGGNTAEEDEGPILYNSPECSNDKTFQVRCGFVQIDSMPLQAKTISDSTPEQYLLDLQFKAIQRQDPGAVLLNQRALTIDSQPAYEITYSLSNVYGHPEGKVSKEIAVKHNGKILDIVYYEFNSRGFITDTGNWQLTPLFEQMFSTFKFLN